MMGFSCLKNVAIPKSRTFREGPLKYIRGRFRHKKDNAGIWCTTGPDQAFRTFCLRDSTFDPDRVR